MLTKTTVISLLTISLLALGGIGYAAFTSSVTANANATGGTLNLIWYSATTDAASASYAICTPSGGGNPQTETFTAKAIAPGDAGCWFDVTIQNTGNIPANTITPSPASGTIFGSDCFTIAYVSAPASLAPGATSPVFYLHIFIDGSVNNNGCEGFSGSQAVTFAGST